MDKKLKLIQRCSSIPILLALLCGIASAQSSISGNLYENTVAVDTVAIGACCSAAAAKIGGITINNSVIQGSVNVTNVNGELHVARTQGRARTVCVERRSKIALSTAHPTIGLPLPTTSHWR